VTGLDACLQEMGSLWGKQQTREATEETAEPFRRINVNCLGNILVILSDQIRDNQDLNLACLHLLFMEARKMGSHDVDYIINWIQNHFEISISVKECENLVSFVGLFLPFEAEMETLEEDFAFVQQRCDLIPPPVPLMREWCAQVKLMERNVRIARGYTTEKTVHVTTKHSASPFASRFGKRSSKKRSPAKISASSVISLQRFSSSQQEAQCGVRDNETGPSREVSHESAQNSPMRILNPSFHVEDEESKECESQLRSSSSANFTRVILLPDAPRASPLDQLPEEKIEDMSSD
jgi:hypothetical protein